MSYREQFELDFEAGLTDQFPEWGDALKASVYSCGKPFKNIAADLDLSSSMLSRMLNPGEASVNFPAHRLSDLIEATGDLKPIYWLVERFCGDTDERRKRALTELIDRLPALLHALERETGDVIDIPIQKQKGA